METRERLEACVARPDEHEAEVTGGALGTHLVGRQLELAQLAPAEVVRDALEDDRVDRTTAQGVVGSYIHMGGKVGVLVEVNCETDFVARTPDFQTLAKEIAMHIAAANPRFLSREQVTPEVLEKEKEIYRAQVQSLGKPAAVVEKIVEGKLAKFYEEFCLLDQRFIKDDKVSVGELVASHVSKVGENVGLRRFARFKVGEES